MEILDASMKIHQFGYKKLVSRDETIFNNAMKNSSQPQKVAINEER